MTTTTGTTTAAEAAPPTHNWAGNLRYGFTRHLRPRTLAELQEQVDDGVIPATAAYEVAKVEDRAVQREIARRIVDEDLTRDDAAAVVREAGGKPARQGGPGGQGSGPASRPTARRRGR